ncbi:MAG: hypothetical protein AUF65_01355 [Chloroflexi bacterium 13_1_20CM_50_12]|nr:MAG: hypothetical protein AUF65_01355 [Chloroflexi bacterium 13_1_20CM_50_12]
MGWIHAGTNGSIERSQEEFLISQKVSCRNASVKVGDDVFNGLDIIHGIRHVKVYGDDWERKTGIAIIDGQEFPVWQDEKWTHWELDPGEIHAKEAAKSDFHYEI